MKINCRRVLVGLMAVGMMAGAVFALGQEDAAYAVAKKVKISKKSISVSVGKKATVKVKNAGKNKVRATTAKKKIVAVSVSGKKVVITGKKVGKTKVTVAVKGMKKATITVTVKAVKKVKTTAVTPPKTTATVSQPILGMQTIPMMSNANSTLTQEQKKLAANMTITGKKIGDRILLCVTNNNNVAIKVQLFGEYYQDVDSEQGALTSRDRLLEANYIAPQGKHYDVFRDYQHKDVYFLALSDIKIGGISCDIADNRNRTDVIKTDFYRGNYGILVARMTEGVLMKENEFNIRAVYVCKDAAGGIIDATFRNFGPLFYNHIGKCGLEELTDTYASIETYYNVSIWGVYDD